MPRELRYLVFKDTAGHRYVVPEGSWYFVRYPTGKLWATNLHDSECSVEVASPVAFIECNGQVDLLGPLCPIENYNPSTL